MTDYSVNIILNHPTAVKLEYERFSSSQEEYAAKLWEVVKNSVIPSLCPFKKWLESRNDEPNNSTQPRTVKVLA